MDRKTEKIIKYQKKYFYIYIINFMIVSSVAYVECIFRDLKMYHLYLYPLIVISVIFSFIIINIIGSKKTGEKK